MKTLLLMLALCGTMLAADKQNLLPEGIRQGVNSGAIKTQPDPAAAAKERHERMILANDFRQVSGKLTPDEVKAVQAIIAKHKAAKPAAPAAKPAKKK